MGKEERILKVLSGLYIATLQTDEDGLIKDVINSGIISLGFKPQNLQSMRHDLEFLENRGYVIKKEQGKYVKYSLTDKGNQLSEKIIKVWEDLRS